MRTLDLGFELFVALSFAWDKPETQDGLMRMMPRKPGMGQTFDSPAAMLTNNSVNDNSILSLKKRALRRTKTLRRDPETTEIVPPSKFSVLKSKIQAPFTRVFWEDALEQTDGETLVDSKLLSYAYLEAGVIEMAGA